MADTITSEAKAPRTERGRRTQRKLLDAAISEFGERGYHEASISAITRRAGVALGSFYTYFDSKDAIFRALVGDMSEGVKRAARGSITPGMRAMEIERAALEGFLRFATEHKELYRIIDEAEFVDPASYRAHYVSTAQRIAERLRQGIARGEMRAGMGETEAWAVMGMNVFLGLRYALWAQAGDPSAEAIAETANRILHDGITAPAHPPAPPPNAAG